MWVSITGRSGNHRNGTCRTVARRVWLWRTSEHQNKVGPGLEHFDFRKHADRRLSEVCVTFVNDLSLQWLISLVCSSQLSAKIAAAVVTQWQTSGKTTGDVCVSFSIWRSTSPRASVNPLSMLRAFFIEFDFVILTDFLLESCLPNAYDRIGPCTSTEYSKVVWAAEDLTEGITATHPKFVFRIRCGKSLLRLRRFPFSVPCLVNSYRACFLPSAKFKLIYPENPVVVSSVFLLTDFRIYTKVHVTLSSDILYSKHDLSSIYWLKILCFLFTNLM